ncbi:hypothetical protein [Enterococcus xiangfangensis]|jgi:parvulin-like peptidyl-prolyl isomerase|uniref:hypothetical protein n=1 Tax=Enterococcus xiangfangensis TaxID=1296537 RepID=UPI0010F894C1|nr:hypothetical protein [Enterococcus xiangfangensis]MBM7710631.1 parvulin-like peptidyl-prolyl isomerase [Enterococcus xiangfangensis]
MTDKNYIDIKGMEERVAEDHQKQKQAFADSMQAITDRNKKQIEESTALFHKAIASSYEDDKKIRDAEIEAEKQKAAKEIEDRFERETGVKSEESLKRETALRGMLKNLKGMND